MNGFDTPVLLLIFNRPEITRVVFDSIRKVRPSRLFIAADGPRMNHRHDRQNCSMAQAITLDVDWPCDVHRLVSESNLGCGRGPVAGISWFFSQVEEGIILEDDIHASPDFFKFCRTLLELYRDDNRVMEVGGLNLVEDQCTNSRYDYYFSNHNHTWGWATWRRAWNFFDFSIKSYHQEIVQRVLKAGFHSDYEHKYFKNLFDATYANNSEITWWDYQWEFARRINGGLSIVPSKNLITNIGLGVEATHTHDANGTGSELKWNDIHFPLKNPDFVMVDEPKDTHYFNRTFSTSLSRFRFQVDKLIPDFFQIKRSATSILESQYVLKKY